MTLILQEGPLPQDDNADQSIWQVAARVLELSPREPEINPFLKGIVIETKTHKIKAKTEEVYAQDDAGDFIEVDNEAREISHVKYVDKARFVKVMNAAFKAALGLSSKGQKMFWLLLEEMGQNIGRDTLYLNYRKEFKVNGEKVVIPKTSFYDGLKALQGAGFIAPKKNERGYYWINPTMLWNGDRVKLSTTYILKHGEKHPDMPVVKRPGKDGARGRRLRASKPV